MKYTRENVYSSLNTFSTANQQNHKAVTVSRCEVTHLYELISVDLYFHCLLPAEPCLHFSNDRSALYLLVAMVSVYQRSIDDAFISFSIKGRSTQIKSSDFWLEFLKHAFFLSLIYSN